MNGTDGRRTRDFAVVIRAKLTADPALAAAVEAERAVAATQQRAYDEALAAGRELTDADLEAVAAGKAALGVIAPALWIASGVLTTAGLARAVRDKERRGGFKGVAK